MQRRTFLTNTALTATSLLTLVPYIRAASKTSFDGTVIGHGEHRYRVDTLWSKADPEKTPVKDCHEMIQSADGHLILLTNHKQNNVIVFGTDGKLADAWTLNFGGAHGLSIHSETTGKQFLYITDAGAGKVVKTTLSGEVILELPSAVACGAYKKSQPYHPTETAIGPTGDIYVADGYGSQYILRFDKEGKFISKFGGKSTQATNKDKFMQAHGVALDTRGAEPLIVCTARIKNEFKWFTLDGKFSHSVYLPGAYVSRPVIAGDYLYSGVCFGSYQYDYRMYQGRGFVTILDKEGTIVSAPGGKQPVYKGKDLTVLLQDQAVFNNCHDVCLDTEQNMYVCQWASDKVYPYKLHRV